VASNIVYVAHLGDVTSHGDDIGREMEWRRATNAMYRLENPLTTLLTNGIPYGVAVGNHDQTPWGSATGTTTQYNQYFGTNHFQGRPYYGGHYGTNSDNHYDLFSASGMDFVVVYFEYDPTATNTNAAIYAWANNVLQTNGNRRAIVVSHYLIDEGFNTSFSPQGAATYDALKGNTNLFLMLCGHVHTNMGEGQRTNSFNGHTVWTVLSDYQARTNGGNGLMRLYGFSPGNNVIRVKTYSPWVNQSETDADSQFDIPYAMTAANPYTAVATNTGVAAGSTASTVWLGRTTNTTYEWYVTVNDGTSTTTGGVWRLTTGSVSNLAPVASNATVQVSADASGGVDLAASDPNGDALRFAVASEPAHGLLSGFDATNGAVIYTPAHGYNGTDTLSFKASDGSLTSGVGVVTLVMPVLADSNSNGLPDAWESAYGVSDPDGDADGDGMTNLQEYRANTNPTNAASVLRITSTEVAAGGQTTIAWLAVGGTRYRVCYADGGASGFIPLVRAIGLEMNPGPVGAPTNQGFVDDFTLTGGPPAVGARFYRISVVW